MTTDRAPDPSPGALAGQYEIRRQVTGLRITLGRLAEQAGVTAATEEEIDAAPDQEG